jgi:4-oxalocrotonate tautomerase
MPYVEIKALEGIFTQSQKQEIIKKFTDVLVSYLGESTRPYIVVAFQNVRDSEWGQGGRSLTSERVLASGKQKQ